MALDAHELITKVIANTLSDIFVALFALSMFPTLHTQTLVTLKRKNLMTKTSKAKQKWTFENKMKCPGGSQKANGANSKGS